LVVEPTHLKNMLVKLDRFPRVRDENKKYLKPPPKDDDDDEVDVIRPPCSHTNLYQ